jgi:hypothetical protein
MPLFNLLELVASFGEEPADKQESTTHRDVEQIEHRGSLHFRKDHFVPGAPELP